MSRCRTSYVHLRSIQAEITSFLFTIFILKGPFVIHSLIPRLTQKQIFIPPETLYHMMFVCITFLADSVVWQKYSPICNFRLSTDGNYNSGLWEPCKYMQLRVTRKFSVRINWNFWNKIFSWISIELYHKKRLLKLRNAPLMQILS